MAGVTVAEVGAIAVGGFKRRFAGCVLAMLEREQAGSVLTEARTGA